MKEIVFIDGMLEDECMQTRVYVHTQHMHIYVFTHILHSAQISRNP